MRPPSALSPICLLSLLACAPQPTDSKPPAPERPAAPAAGAKSDAAYELLVCGRTRAGTLEPRAPWRYYAFQGRAGQTVDLDLQATTPGLDLLLAVVAPDGRTVLGFNDDCTVGSTDACMHGLQLTATGRHWVWAASFGGTGDYRLDATCDTTGQPCLGDATCAPGQVCRRVPGQRLRTACTDAAGRPAAAGAREHYFAANVPGTPTLEVDPGPPSVRAIGQTENLPVVGVAWRPAPARLYARLMPGTVLVEYDLARGERHEIALPVSSSGCFSELIELEAGPSCGLTLRWADGHLFVDEPAPGSRTIHEVALRTDARGFRVADLVGSFEIQATRSTPVGLPVTPIGGLGFHQTRGTLWATFVGTQVVVEADARNGHIRSAVQLGALTPGTSLAIDSATDRIVTHLQNGVMLGAFDLAGGLQQSISVHASAGPAGGSGAGPRRRPLVP